MNNCRSGRRVKLVPFWVDLFLFVVAFVPLLMAAPAWTRHFLETLVFLPSRASCTSCLLGPWYSHQEGDSISSASCLLSSDDLQSLQSY